MPVKFNVLGSFQVIDGDRAIALGGYKQRAALAVLLLSANRVVSLNSLIDDLWGGAPPRQASGSLQAYISKLRRALEPHRGPREPPRVLCSHAGGYVLSVDLADIDSALFEHRASEGRALLRQGRPHAAREALAQALGLWRGPALAEFADEQFARAEAVRLEDLRRVALEERIAADLALGEHAAVTAEVQKLVADDPLREALWAHLILALYRCGRQGDALAAYRQCRGTLDRELGIEPRAALRQLETDVLHQAQSLDWNPPEPAAARSGEGDRAAAFLVCDVGDRQRTYVVDASTTQVRIGRDSTADVWLSWDSRVSRHHAELEYRRGGWILVDDGTSSNGSFVNGVRVDGRRAVQHDDKLRFGVTTLTFLRCEDSSAAETCLDE